MNSIDHPAADRKRVQLRYKYFRGVIATWDELFGNAARFATEVGRENVLTISHSEDKNDGVVAVWYWGEADDAQS